MRTKPCNKHDPISSAPGLAENGSSSVLTACVQLKPAVLLSHQMRMASRWSAAVAFVKVALMMNSTPITQCLTSTAVAVWRLLCCFGLCACSEDVAVCLSVAPSACCCACCYIYVFIKKYCLPGTGLVRQLDWPVAHLVSVWCSWVHATAEVELCSVVMVPKSSLRAA